MKKSLKKLSRFLAARKRRSDRKTVIVAAPVKKGEHAERRKRHRDKHLANTLEPKT